MHREAIAEIGGSLIIAAITGLNTVGEFALAGYAFLAFHPSLKASGIILLLFGIVNLPIFVMWSRQAANEIATWSDSPPTNMRNLQAHR
jgi:hypothetical protein